MTLEEQMNALTRLIIVIFLIMLLFNITYSICFLIAGIALIIILFYVQRKKMQGCQENYTNLQFPTKLEVNPSSICQIPSDTKNDINTYILRNEGPQFFCNDQVPFQMNQPYYKSVNFALSKGQNPQTKVPPPIIPPIMSDHWKANDLVVRSGINSTTQKESYLSGYAVSNCCSMNNKTIIPESQEDYITPKPAEAMPFMNTSFRPQYVEEGYTTPKPAQAMPFMNTSFRPQYVEEGYRDENKEDYITPKPAQAMPFMNTSFRPQYVQEGYEEGYDGAYYQTPERARVSSSCGYNVPIPEQNNYDKEANLYVKNLTTQNVQPDTYSYSEVMEPINANIGISFQPQFPPLSCHRNDDGVLYTESMNYPTPKPSNEGYTITTDPADVYDPRFSGYGTSYRSYTDENLGQTRYAYDDVDAIRRPNYITRSKIDFLPYADSYGPMKPNAEFGNPLTHDIRGLVQDSWMRNSLQFRNELSERLMRKINNEHWQRRVAPKYT